MCGKEEQGAFEERSGLRLTWTVQRGEWLRRDQKGM